VSSSLNAGDWAVLALVAEAPTHGWAVAERLTRGGEVGSIWSLGRPLVYQSLERLNQQGLIEERGIERGERGPHRVVYGVTTGGRKAVRDWLRKPVEHVRDIRSFFLLKIVLAQRAGLDVEPLLAAQRATIAPFLAYLEARLDDVDGLGPPSPEETTLRFRIETTSSVLRFIDELLGEMRKRSKRAGKRSARR
jgi:DNA-binding PadR family transcriptional regulator